VPAGIHKIKHVIIVMQENRSFDTYFGTFPGGGRDPHEERHAGRVRTQSGEGGWRGGGCTRPYHDTVPAYFRGKPPCVGCTTAPPGV